MDLKSCSTDEIRRVLDASHSDIRLIAKDHPEIIEQLEAQYNVDKSTLGRLPKFICVPTNSGLVNTTIPYREFLRFLPLFKQRPDLIDTGFADGIIHRREIGLADPSVSTYAKVTMGSIPLPKGDK